ncbi:OprO/OprP family phosphate-selective porin [Oleisolibacter albus]|uniref:OprO/OprP family phosphate-selective porin n=1 Tax=Oleisolibacter albus TaxID=2171757 RepID=UPI000DF17270|nr:porin [Oleisolibacter albus]
MSFKSTLLVGTVLGITAIASAPAFAQSARPATSPAPASAPVATSAQIDALNRQIQALQSQLDTLKETVGKDIKAVDKKVSDQAVLSVANGRPRFTSADKAFDVALRSRVHLDYGYWFADKGVTEDLPDGFNFRRAFLGLTGTVFKDWGFEVNTDFSGRTNPSARLQAANFSYTGFKNWSIDFGAMQPSFTLMDSVSSNDIPFIERSQTNNLAVANVANESRLAAGFRHWGDRYRVSVYLTGDTIGTAARDDQASVIGRASVLAATGNDYDVHLGTSAGYMYEPGQTAGAGSPRNYSLSERPETRIGGGTVLVNTGNINTEDFTVYGGEFGATYKSFWTMAEYFQYDFSRRGGLSDLSFDSWYVAAGWFLTGERRPYSVASGAFGAPRIQWPFKTSGGYGVGAWEIAARYSTADLTSSKINVATEGKQDIVTLGLNWYPNAAFRFMLNYNFIKVDRPTGTDVNLDALTLRAQFQF